MEVRLYLIRLSSNFSNFDLTPLDVLQYNPNLKYKNMTEFSVCEPGVPEKWNTWYEQRFNIPGNKKNSAAKKYGKIENAIIECPLVEEHFTGGHIGLGIGCDQVDFQGARAAGKLSAILRVPNRWYVLTYFIYKN